MPASRAEEAPRVALLRRLQQGAGNASVSRFLSQAVAESQAPTGQTEVEPHGPGEDADTAGVLDDASRQPDEGGITGLLAAVGTAMRDGAREDAAPARAAGPIAKSVGAGGANEPADVKVVSDLLGSVGLTPAGVAVDALAGAITRYQAEALGWPRQDGRVDPGGKTITALAAGRKPSPSPQQPTTAGPLPTAAPDKAPPTTAPPAATPPVGTVDAALQGWAAQQPATNPEWAKSILDAVTHGFVTIKAGTRKQLEQFVDGKTVLSADGGASAALLGGLATVGAMIRGRATRWLADPSQGKQPFFFGDFVRDLKGLSIKDAHSGGAAVDIGGFDWTGANGPKQVMQTFEDLPAGTYTVGLPFQGQFFPLQENLAVRKKAAEKAAGEGAAPADVDSPSLVMWKGTRETATWNADKKRWDDKVVSYDASSRLKSAELKAKVAELKSKGKSIGIFPDMPNHIHIKRM